MNETRGRTISIGAAASIAAALAGLLALQGCEDGHARQDAGTDAPRSDAVPIDVPATDTPAGETPPRDGPGGSDAVVSPDGTGGACGIVQIALGLEHSCALRSDGGVICWGSTPSDGGALASTSPTPIDGISGARQLAAGGNQTCVLDDAGKIVCWFGGAGAGMALAAKNLPTGVRPLAMTIGAHAACARTDSLSYCWGSNPYGELGNGTSGIIPQVDPLPVDDGGGVSSATAWISMGGGSACAVRAGDGSTWCWGDNSSGQLGDDKSYGQNVPIPVLGLSGGVAEVAVGAAHACAVRNDRSVVCWGVNLAGELGDGTTGNPRALPRLVGPFPSGVGRLATNGDANHTCALTGDGGVWCWGEDRYGQVGTAEVAASFDARQPNRVMSGVRQVAIGGNHTCVLKLDGTVWCWGRNDSRQLGVAGPSTAAPQKVPLECTAPVPGPDAGAPAVTDGGVDGRGDASGRDAGDGPAPRPGPWVDRTPAILPFTWPGHRPGAAVAFDRARGRTVLLTGVGDDRYNVHQMWEWDGGATWTNRTPYGPPIDWPGAISVPAMAYDESRAQVVVYGTDFRAWDWSGSGAWTDRTPLPLPALWLPPSGVVVSYDVARARLVAFQAAQQQLWEGDLATNQWALPPVSLTEPRPAPSSSDPLAFVYDRARGVDVLIYRGTPVLQVWEWNGTAWRDRTVTTYPTVSTVVAAYDDVRHTVTLLDRGDFITPNAGGAVWEWNGEMGTWTKRAASAGASAWPKPREANVVTYDSTRQRFVSYGYSTIGAWAADCWEWDSATAAWTDRTPPQIAEPWPDVADAPVMFSDAARGRVFTFNAAVGLAPVASSHDIYEWDPANGRWILRTPTPRPATWPPDRNGFAVAVDDDRRKLLLIGGSDVGAPRASRNDLWEMDLDTFTWSDRTTSGAAWPGARRDPALAFDRARGRAVLFGGSGTTYLSDLWEWNPATGSWTERTSPLGFVWPGGRSTHTMVYDSARARVVLYGGFDAFVLDDLWEWDGAAGQFVDRSPATRPPAWPAGRESHGAVYDPVRARMVVVGGYSSLGGGIVDDTLEWDGAAGTWTRRAVNSVRPRNRKHPGLAWDAARARVVLFGGSVSPPDPEYFGADTWEYDGAVQE